MWSFRTGTPAAQKGICSPEYWYKDDLLLLILSGGEIPSFFGQMSFTAAAPAQGKGWLLEGLKATLLGKWFYLPGTVRQGLGSKSLCSFLLVGAPAHLQLKLALPFWRTVS